MRVHGVFLTSASAVLLLAGCGAFGPSDLELALQENEALWAARTLQDYEFEFFGGCFCSPEFTQWVTVTVQDGAIIAVEAAPDGVPISEGTRLDAWRTVPELFETLRDAVDGDGSIEWRIEADFDATSGYPTLISLSPKNNDVTDAGINYQARNLTPAG